MEKPSRSMPVRCCTQIRGWGQHHTWGAGWKATSITSTRGDVLVKANDDVTLKGERVHLNP